MQPGTRTASSRRVRSVNSALRFLLALLFAISFGGVATASPPESPTKPVPTAKPQPIKTGQPPAAKDDDDDEIILEDDESPAEKPTSKQPVSKPIRALFSGHYSSRFGVDFSFDGAQEDIFEWRNRLDLNLSYEAGANFKVVTNGRFTHWLWLEGEKEAGDTRQATDRSTYAADLREAYLVWRLQMGLEITLGQRILTWGRTDFSKPLDVLSPIDLRDGPIDMNATSRLSVFNLELSQTIGNVNLSLVWIPFFRPNRMELFGSDWSMLKPQLKLPVPAEYLGLLGAIHPTRYEEMQGLLSSTEDPAQDGIRGADVGFRLTTNWGGVDLGLAYAYQWDKMPMVKIDSERITTSMLGVIGGDSKSVDALRDAMQIRYERRHVVGFDMNVVFGSFSLKADVAYLHEHTLYTEDFDSLRHPSIAWALQLDYLYENSLAISVEFSHQAFFGVPENTSLMFFEADMMRLSAMIEARFGRNDMFRLQLAGMYGITQKDLIVTPRFTWRQSGLLSLDVGAMIFIGDPDILSMGSLFETASFGYMSARLSF